MYIFLSLLCIIIPQILCNPTFQVQSPVADLRFHAEAPSADLKLPTSDVSNAGQITQLLFGEHVQVHETFIDQYNQTWFWIHALQQERFDQETGWHGYPGWILAQDIQAVNQLRQHNAIIKTMQAAIVNEHNEPVQYFSIGSRLSATPINDQWWQFARNEEQFGYIHNNDIYFLQPKVTESAEQLRAAITQKAQEFLGNWYSWGGRSAQDESRTISSVDCSALVNLCFLSVGLQIPRMSHEQFLRSNRIDCCQDLQPADLIFFISITKQSARIDHVMMYLGNDQILESTYADDKKVRIVSFQERFGQSCNIMMDDNIVEWRGEQFRVFFGSFLNEESLIQKLRDDALKFEY